MIIQRAKTKMKDLIEIAKEDITEKFNELYKKAHEVRVYIFKKYGIDDSEITAYQRGDPSYNMDNIFETEKTIYKIISSHKKK